MIIGTSLIKFQLESTRFLVFENIKKIKINNMILKGFQLNKSQILTFNSNENISIRLLTLEDIDVYSTDAMEENNIISFTKTENLEIQKFNIKNIQMVPIENQF